jgi:hypothetical protein
VLHLIGDLPPHQALVEHFMQVVLALVLGILLLLEHIKLRMAAAVLPILMAVTIWLSLNFRLMGHYVYLQPMLVARLMSNPIVWFAMLQEI